jgi:hypothetical protein
LTKKIRLILSILARPTFGPNPFVSSSLSKICQFPNKIDILSFVSWLHSLPSKNVSLCQAGQFRVYNPPATVSGPRAGRSEVSAMSPESFRGSCGLKICAHLCSSVALVSARHAQIHHYLTALRIKNLEKIPDTGFFELSHAFCTTHANFQKQTSYKTMFINDIRKTRSARPIEAQPKIFPIGDATVRRAFYLHTL